MVAARSGNLFAPNNFMSVDDTPLLVGAIGSGSQRCGKSCDYAYVFGEEKIYCPVECHANFFVQTRQLAEINRPSHAGIEQRPLD
jgi:hypothetical protein